MLLEPEQTEFPRFSYVNINTRYWRGNFEVAAKHDTLGTLNLRAVFEARMNKINRCIKHRSQQGFLSSHMENFFMDVFY